MDEGASATLDRLFRALSLSGRAYSRILKTARTIADLDNSEKIQKKHISEAAQYRIDEEQK
jgi:magnesium chelatase family protein